MDGGRPRLPFRRLRMLVRFLKQVGPWAEGDVRESEGHELEQFLLNGIVEPADGGRKPAAERKARTATVKADHRTANVENEG